MPKKIRIGSMSVTTTETTLYNRFDDYGSIVAHSIDRDSFGNSLGVGHVEYTTDQAGTDAIAGANLTMLDGARIEVAAE